MKKGNVGRSLGLVLGRYESEVAYKIPIVMKSEEEKEVLLEVEVYEVDAAWVYISS